MNRQEEQLKEAEKIVRSVQNGTQKYRDADNYLDKYHPKDELFEKWKDLLELLDINREWDRSLDMFNKAKELGLIKEPKDKVIALDEAIIRTSTFNRIGPVVSLTELEEIRSKYTKD